MMSVLVPFLSMNPLPVAPCGGFPSISQSNVWEERRSCFPFLWFPLRPSWSWTSPSCSPLTSASPRSSPFFLMLQWFVWYLDRLHGRRQCVKMRKGGRKRDASLVVDDVICRVVALLRFRLASSPPCTHWECSSLPLPSVSISFHLPLFHFLYFAAFSLMWLWIHSFPQTLSFIGFILHKTGAKVVLMTRCASQIPAKTLLSHAVSFAGFRSSFRSRRMEKFLFLCDSLHWFGEYSASRVCIAFLHPLHRHPHVSVCAGTPGMGRGGWSNLTYFVMFSAQGLFAGAIETAVAFSMSLHYADRLGQVISLFILSDISCCFSTNLMYDFCVYWCADGQVMAIQETAIGIASMIGPLFGGSLYSLFGFFLTLLGTLTLSISLSFLLFCCVKRFGRRWICFFSSSFLLTFPQQYRSYTSFSFVWFFSSFPIEKQTVLFLVYRPISIPLSCDPCNLDIESSESLASVEETCDDYFMLSSSSLSTSLPSPSSLEHSLDAVPLDSSQSTQSEMKDAVEISSCFLISSFLYPLLSIVSPVFSASLLFTVIILSIQSVTMVVMVRVFFGRSIAALFLINFLSGDSFHFFLFLNVHL